MTSPVQTTGIHILHIASRYWPCVGGGETYLREISERFAAEGHTVTVATTDADESERLWDPRRGRLTLREEKHEGVAIRRFPLRYWPLSPYSYSLWRYLIFPCLTQLPFVPIEYLTRLARYTPWSPELWQWVETTLERFDVVGTMGILYEPFVAAGQRFARHHRIPLIVTPLTHLGAGRQPARDKVSRYYTMRHQRELVRQAEAVIAMTSTERHFYEAQGVAPERIEVCGAGVNPSAILGGQAERFRQRHQLHGPLVVFLSALAFDKGATHVVEAVRRLWAEGLMVELVMAGTVWSSFQNYLDGISDADRHRIRLLGRISDDDKRDLLAAADVVAMPSRTDSFGIIFLEAWLHRKPVVGAKAWGMSDVIRDTVDGCLVPFGDVTALSTTLARLLADPALRTRLGEAGERKVYDQYTWDKVFARIRPVYLSRANRA